MDAERRQERLRTARLYFVCDAGRTPEELDALLGQALAGGVDVIQLRDKHAPDGALRAAGGLFREAASAAGALFILNDRPDLVGELGADGVHVGQEDAPVSDARAAAGAGALVGLSTHAPPQLDTALQASAPNRPDYVSVGPVWETPTKPGRPAAGIDYVRYAAANTDPDLPWFAIGSIDTSNVAEVVTAGARRIVVVRAIRDSEEPAAIARELRAAVAEPAAAG
jgi:thiamine-phosphate pyrophosphorylase